MTDTDQRPNQRAARLAEALRTNLRRRKAQAREQDGPAPTTPETIED